MDLAKKSLLLLFLALPCLDACTHTSRQAAVKTPTAQQDGVDTVQAVIVPKTVHKKVFVHLMPWFETKASNLPPGTWGIHWTMAKCNPDILGADGRREIASYYHPLIGPYASGDKYVIEYQLLLMKMSGIDGVFIDWPGTIHLYDYPKNAANTDSIVSVLNRVGLRFAVVYEDQNVGIAFKQKAISDKIKAAQQDMTYLRDHFFNNKNYEYFNGKPLLLDFGPQAFNTEGEWDSIFSVLKNPPSFFVLWDHGNLAGKAAVGEFAWINQDNLTSLKKFYSSDYRGYKIASAYPGFNPYYTKGGWDGPTFVIPDDGVQNFQETLDLALGSSAAYIQIPTWNDYGEGTIIAPTVEFKYSFLTTLQKTLGASLNQADLELVAKLYALRVQYKNNPPMQKKLDQVFDALSTLHIGEATKLLHTIPTNSAGS